MSDFHDVPTHPTARKPHRCIWCYAGIPAGEKYTQQTGIFEGSRYRNRYHDECWTDATDDEACEFEFTPGCGVPPERLQESAGNP